MCILAVDVGGSKILAAAFKGGKPYSMLEIATKPESLVNDLQGLVVGLAIRECGGRPSIVGVASVGPLDYSMLEIVGAPNLGGGRIELWKALESLEAPVLVANDAVASLWAEVHLGKARGLQDAAMVVLGTGVGGAAMVDGRLILGRRGGAHEVGHIVVDYDSKSRCGCGGLGHWEAIAGARWLPAVIENVTKGRIAPSSPNEAVEWLKKGVESGDLDALRVLESLARVNAAGIASIIAVYDPQAVFVAGGLAEALGQHHLNRVRMLVREYSIYEPPPILEGSFGRLQALYGAYSIAYRPPREILSLNTHRLSPTRGVEGRAGI